MKRSPKIKTEQEIAYEIKQEKARYDKQREIFGFGDNATTFKLDDKALYGFAFYDPKRKYWACYAGSFYFVYGLHMGILAVADEDRETDETVDICYSAFFTLDSKANATAIIPRIALTPEQHRNLSGFDQQHGVVLADLIYYPYFVTSPRQYPPTLAFEA